jgi:glycosyltransferase involved in cell wall biosynthesis
LRLLFSGRLVAMKGGDHLIRVASELQRLGTAFEMTICGGGCQEPQMKAEVARLGLGDRVKFAGVLDFKTDLTPMVKRRADLFVCCHRSGDPSCTYLETMACGVPIVGYENEAFKGLVRESGAGWATEMDRPVRLASKIAELAANRRAIVDASRQALAFARLWTFEETFKARIEHLKSCAVAGLAGQGWGGRLALAARAQAGLEDRRVGSA